MSNTFFMNSQAAEEIAARASNSLRCSVSVASTIHTVTFRDMSTGATIDRHRGSLDSANREQEAGKIVNLFKALREEAGSL
jgi:hypothetical protein